MRSGGPTCGIGRHSTIYAGPDKDYVSSTVGECSCSDASPSSGSGTSGGGRLLQHLVAETKVRQPVPVVPSEPAGLEVLLRSLLSGQLALAQEPRPRSFRREWHAVVCFSCGKAGHSATCCPTLDDTFPFMLPGWKTEKTLGGYMMISPRAAAELRRVENGD